VNRYNDALLVGPIPHDHARVYNRKSKVAVVEGEKRLTWSDLSERTARLAYVLKRLGIGRGDRVAAILQNRAEYVEAIYAIAGLGATIVPVSFRFIPREMVYALTHSSAAAAIVDADLLDTFTAANAEVGLEPERVLVVGDMNHSFTDYETALGSADASIDYLVGEETDVYHLAFTGGTTGYPKACQVPQRVALHNWYDMTVEVGILEGDTTLIAGPFYHGLGFMGGLQQLMVGGTVVMLPRFDATQVLKTFAEERITWTPMAPTMYTMLLEKLRERPYDVGSLRGLVCAASPLPVATKKEVLERFPTTGLYEYYGSTEAGFYTVLKPVDQLRKVGSVGQPWRGCALRVLDADGNDLPIGEVGRVYKRGMSLGAAYLNSSEATAAAFRSEWMTNDDLGYLDDEGYLYLVGRAKDMIISGGVNIYPAEIEEALVTHPAVFQAAVVGLPDERWGEIVTAFVVVCEGMSVSEEELIGLCRERLAGYKCPRAVHFLSELPQNSSGKILKSELRNAPVVTEC
jgi:acyl-CoA synthetase (AMP-forming)/AMP-acid ligase II